MKKSTLFKTILTAITLTIGLTFLSFAKEISVMDQNGSWYNVDVPEEINGLKFAEYIDASNTVTYCGESEIPYESDFYLYDANTLQPVEGGWYLYDSPSDVFGNKWKRWMYASPKGDGFLLRNSWILDNGQMYLANSYGVTRQNEMIDLGDIVKTTGDVIYNVQIATWETMPFTLVGNSYSLMLPYGGLNVDDFIRTASGANYEAWVAEWNRVEAEWAAKQTEANLDWSMFDLYVPQALSDRGIYSYEIIGRDRITNYMFGEGVYKVKLPNGNGSYTTRYLTVYINSDGSYWKSSI